jgi:hypothetical protein
MRRRSFLGALASIPVVGLVAQKWKTVGDARTNPNVGCPAGAHELPVWIKDEHSLGEPYDLTEVSDLYARDEQDRPLEIRRSEPYTEGRVVVIVPNGTKGIRIGWYAGRPIEATAISLEGWKTL